MATEREFLRECSRSSNKEEAWRAEVVLLSAGGKTAAEISESMGFHPANVKKWIRKFNKEGITGLAVKKRGPQGGPRPRFFPAQVEQILKLAKTDPVHLGLRFKEWTPQKLATVAVERGIVDSISHVTVRQLLKRNGNSEAAEKLVLEGTHTSGSAKLGVVDPADQLKGSHLEIAQQALSQSNYQQAVDHLNAALVEGPHSPEEEASLRLLLTKALEELSRYEEAYKVIGKYEDHSALGQLPSPMRARVKLRIGWVHSWLWNVPKAIAALNETRKLFLEAEDEIGVSEANYALGRTYNAIDEFRIARDYLLTAVDSQKKARDRELLARIYDQLGTSDFNEGAFTSAFENYSKAFELAESSPKLNLRGMILLNLGTVHSEGYLGDRQVASDYVLRAIEYLKKGGHTDYLASAYNNLAENLRASGLWEEAIENLNNSIEIALPFPDHRVVTTALITLAEILCAKGRFADAEKHLNMSIELVGGSAAKWLETNALIVLGRVYCATGRAEDAIQSLRQALRLATSIGDLHGVTLAQVELAQFHYEHAGYDQAGEYLELAQGRLKEEKSLVISGLIQRLTGQLEAARGRYAEAKQHIAQSISIFTTTDIPFEVARSQYELALLLIKSREIKAAETNLVQARQFFETVSAEPDLRRVLKALEALVAGEQPEQAVARSLTDSDVLLMQRLIEASATRELLLQELAAVVYENFQTVAVVVFRLEGDDRVAVIVSQGISLIEAEELGREVRASLLTGGRSGNTYVFRLSDGSSPGIALCVQASPTLEISRLQPLLRQAEFGLETCSLRSSARLSSKPSLEHRVQTIIPGFLCYSALMLDVIERIQKIRTSDVTVLITGESGTGKELIARAIHAGSARARAIFLPFNCTATPKEIIDSQLFGHRRGSFTGATANYPGIIKASDGGTLFLDEIGDLSLEVQPKLMRFLQESEIQTIGETKPLRVDVRVLAATNTDLERAVDEGRFREDLFHRLNIIRIHVPPLRDRREEVPILAAHFLEHFSSRSGKQGLELSREAMDALTNNDWPGNVRQLRNEIERVVAYASEKARISPEDLSPEVANPRKALGNGRTGGMSGRQALPMRGHEDSVSNGGQVQRAGGAPVRVKLKEATSALERVLIEEALVRNRNNLSRTALDLGLSRRGLRLKLGQLGIQRFEQS
ncbi:MAG TPA: sigma 54-interacting transcriptional regulator [Blastocatellia bacterium]|jgi:DNA-binding NtrC family response regulator/tetratricopeptide (TPR) repeat protein/transposase|nr:sigma 54-interacting transcriptional regulator [Blastocatellia bacterium]